MSMPKFPETNPDVTRDDVINQVISSIAMEELGLSHILNAEGEKLQYVLGTLEGVPGLQKPPTIEELLEVNRSVRELLESASDNQSALSDKLGAALGTSGGKPGPPGPTGPVGTILDSFETLKDLQEAHATGKQGDAYLVGGKLYVWKEGATDWEYVGDLSGPQGTGTTIKGEGVSKDQLDTDHPNGPPEDAYIIDGEIYIWNKEDGWHSAGSLRGPQGIGTLIKDSYPSLAALEHDHPNGPPEDGYLIDGKLYVWTEGKGWHSVGDLRGPAATSYTIIPFGSGEAPLTYSTNGNPTTVSLLGFGYGDRRGEGTLNAANYSISIEPNNHSFALNRANNAPNRQVVLSLPFDMIIKSIYITVGTVEAWTFPSKVYPYVQLYKADPGTNNFIRIDGAVAMPTNPIGSGAVPSDTMRDASITGLNIPLPAGTRLAIGGMMRTEDSTTANESYWLYFTGGIGMAFDAN